MQEFVGEPTMSRPQVVKKIWAYIKEHNLQNPSDKREINCDAALKKLTGQDTVTMFSINKHIKEHFLPG